MPAPLNHPPYNTNGEGGRPAKYIRNLSKQKVTPLKNG